MDAMEKSDGLKAFLMDQKVGISEPVAAKFVEGVTKNAISGMDALNQGDSFTFQKKEKM